MTDLPTHSSNTWNGRRNENGFAIRGWGGLASFAAVVSVFLALFIGVLQWGLKLEEEINAERAEVRHLEQRIAQLEQKVGNGILPRAEERIEALRRDLDEHEDGHD